MEYTQRNPVPLPASGPLATIQTQMDTTFDWEYALKQHKLLALYEKGKAATWNASDLDWSIEVDIEKLMASRREAAGGVSSSIGSWTRPSPSTRSARWSSTST